MQQQQNYTDIEKAVCSALLQSEDSRRELPSYITVDCFTTQQTRLVFAAINEMMLSGSKIDMITVCDFLRKKGELQAAGDMFGIATLAGFVSLSVNLEEYCAILHQQNLRRNLALAGQKVLQLSADNSIDVADSVSEALKLIEGISQGMCIENGLETIYDISKRTIDRYNERKMQRQQGMNTAITTGLTELDNILNGGFKPGQMIILAGRPGSGKTASLLSMAKAAAKDDKNVFIVSLEMDSDSLVDRMVLGESNINAHMFKTARLSSEDENKAAGAAISLSGLPILINDTASQTMAQIKSQAKKLKREGKLDIIYIDYLQLINSATSNKNYNKNNEITELSRQTKLLAKDLGVPVVILSQLSRAAAAAGEEGTPPSLHHLRDSGSLEQDADMVLFVHRSFYYTKDENERYEGNIIVAKQRDGAAGVSIKFSCNANLSAIFDYTQNNPNNPF